MKQRLQLWRQIRHDIRFATPERQLEVEAFLSVLEDILQESCHLNYVPASLDIEERTLRALRVMATLPAGAAVEVIERTAIARSN